MENVDILRMLREFGIECQYELLKSDLGEDPTSAEVYKWICCE